MESSTASTAPRAALTRALVLTVLAAALATAPLFLLAEGFERDALERVVASNGACVVLCLGLLELVRRGQAELAARALVGGLLGLVTVLAWINGEPVHVNVVNFVLVTLLAAVLLGPAPLPFIGMFCAAAMIAIAWDRAVPSRAHETLLGARLESIVQFAPTYVVIVLVLWLRERRSSAEA